MKLTAPEQHKTLPLAPMQNRRRGLRIPGRCTLTFSGVDGRQLVMGNGRIMDVSEEGIGIRGNRLLKHGMELALFLELPDTEDHLCVPEARVSWVKGRRFGVALRTLRREDRNRLRLLFGKAAHGAPGLSR